MRSIPNKAVVAAAGLLAALVCCAGPGATLGTLPDCDATICPQESFQPSPTDAAVDAVDADASAAARLCAADECPAPLATCTGDPFICQTNLMTDSYNCGACGNVCPAFYSVNVLTTCIEGQCVPICNLRGGGDYRDCNGIPDDGCEVDIGKDAKNCGACGNECQEDKPCGVHTDGVCGCPDGMTLCDGECVDLSQDWDNCGRCGNECVRPDGGTLPPHMDYFCMGGECAVPDCTHDRTHRWEDCNGDKTVPEGDGCEVDVGSQVRDPNNCGACGRTCPEGQTCEAMGDGSWADCACPEPLTLCTTRYITGCEDLSNDPWNCGNCGHACEANSYGATETASCIDGVCVRECLDGYADCNGLDGDPRIGSHDGCETNIARDPHNCGACGVTCEANQPCIDGRCLMTECDAGTVTK